MEESQKQAMIDAYKKRILSQANGMVESPMLQICLTAFRHGVENTLAEVDPKQQKLKKLADAMYHAAQYLTTDASHLRKAMDEYHQFIIQNKIWSDMATTEKQVNMENEQQTAIIIKGKVHRLTTLPQNEPVLCKDCSLQELCDRLEENILCDFIGDCRGHHIFKCDNLKG